MTADTTRRAVHVTISGRVQAVGFRYWTERNAAKLELDGRVRNRRDDSVEAIFCGPGDAVDEMRGAGITADNGDRAPFSFCRQGSGDAALFSIGLHTNFVKMQPQRNSNMPIMSRSRRKAFIEAGFDSECRAAAPHADARPDGETYILIVIGQASAAPTRILTLPMFPPQS